ncbi:50S ribosomal protein L18 [candidate division WOR-3 bacterium RBG_13_43_14]|uniref:Large ribosomal subunit protein uL18 n=1 Tax=candidate division WOR-3 bacterium RBG_13_43_14 TaxID=1802590 RepID=A0A1F4UC34_UNCW3|nr:MAG: 50S ribosomal protein L18 [candidate division WOR-3 bacterium RBG_13_43_14]
MKLVGRKLRHQRIRKKVFGTKDRPRFCVFRSNRHIYAQLIDDQSQRVIIGTSSLVKDTAKGKKKTEIAFETGKRIGKTAVEKGIKTVTFDRAGYKYHGRIKAVADGAREAGLIF